MTTLGTLKSQIADDLARGDLTTQIAAAINSAIDFYKEERFFINETRDATFVTVADQTTYDVDDDADIPLFIKIDAMFVEDSDSQRFELDRIDPVEMEMLLNDGAATGRPVSWSYFNQAFSFYPIPDAVYTVRPMGQIEVAAPAADDTTGNVWMTRGFELLRCTAKAYLYAHTIKNLQMAGVMGAAEGRARDNLRRETSKRRASGQIVATQF